MKISVKDQSLSNNIIEQTEVRWNLHFKKIKKGLIILMTFALLLLIIGISTGNKYSMINTGDKKLYFNLNLFTAIGISSLLVLLYVIRQVNLSKKNFLSAGREIAKKFEAIDEISYEFNDLEIIIDRKLQFEKINWNLFVKKIYHDKFIFLNFSDKVHDGIAINASHFSDVDWNSIKEFIDKKVK